MYNFTGNQSLPENFKLRSFTPQVINVILSVWIIDRLYWDTWDPHIIAEGLFAIANVISFTRLSYIFPANELFGPMQISVAQMITDILKFGAVFFVFFTAFFVGLHNLYWYYPKDVRGKVELVKTDIQTNAEMNFGVPHITFRTVFWSLFGRGEPTAVQVEPFGHKFTETIGYWIFGVYNFCTVIVLLNMLIAMMSRSFELIQTFYYMLKSVFGCCCSGDDEDGAIAHPGRVVDLEMFPASSNVNQTRRKGNVQQSWDEQEQRAGQGIKHFQEKMHTTNGFQDISSFRYEMLNHISVRQNETAENKDRLDKLTSKMDLILTQQLQLLRLMGEKPSLQESLSSTSTLSCDRDTYIGNASLDDGSSSLERSASVTSSILEDDEETFLPKKKPDLQDIPEEAASEHPEEDKGYNSKQEQDKRTASLKQVVSRHRKPSSEDDPEPTEGGVATKDIMVDVQISPLPKNDFSLASFK
ncbi:TRPC6-like protein, partial [Mya arenaria]